MSTIASLVATLGLDASNFNRGVDDAQQKAGGLKGALSSFSGASLMAVGAGALAAGAGIGSAIGVASTFQHQMSAVGAVAGASGSELEALSDKALQLGADTAFGATEAAGAMEILAGNGILVGDILGGAADAAVALAAAGGTTLATAADTVSTAMAVWGLSAAETAVVTNMLAGAANVSRFGVEDMSLAIAQGGGAAATAGVSFEDFTTSIAAIAPSFSSGADAGTSMKTMLSRLTPSTKAAKEAMYELNLMGENGLPIWFDSQGNFKGMASVAQALHDQIGPLSDSQKTLALNTIFGSDAMRAAAAMSTMTAESFTEMQNTMINTDAAAVAAQRMNNFKGAMDQVGGSIETIQIRIGMWLLPALTVLAMAFASTLPIAFDALISAVTHGWAAIEPLREVLVSLAQEVASKVLPKLEAFADWFRGNQTAMKAAGAAIGAIAAAGFGALAVAAAGAVVAIGLAVAPFVALVAVIGAVGAGIYLLITNWDQITAKFPVLASAVEIAKTAFQFLAEAGEKVLGFLMKHKDVIVVFGAALAVAVPIVYAIAAAQLAQAAAATTAAVATNVALLPVIAIAAAIAILVAGIYLLIKHWDDITAKFPILGTIVDGVRAALSSFADWISSALLPVLQKFPDQVANAWRGLSDAVTNTFDAVKTAITSVWSAIGDTVLSALGGILDQVVIWGSHLVDQLKLGLEALGIIFEAAFKIVVAVLNTYFQIIKNAVQLFIDVFQGNWRGAWENLKDIVSSVWDGLKAVVSAGLSAIAQLIPIAMQAVLNVLETAWASAKDLAALAWDGIVAAVKAGIALIKALASIDMMEVGKFLIETMEKAARAAWPVVLSWLQSLPGLAKAGLEAGAGMLDSAGRALLEALKTGAVAIWNTVIGWVATLPGLAKDSILLTANLLDDAGRAIIDKFREGIEWAAGLVWSYVKSIPQKIVDSIGDVSKLLFKVGEDMMQGLIDGITSKLGAAKDAVGGFFGDLVKKGKDVIDSDSPSKVFMAIGRDIVDGLVIGINTNAPKVLGAIGLMGAGAIDMMSKMGEKAANAFSIKVFGASGGGGGDKPSNGEEFKTGSGAKWVYKDGKWYLETDESHSSNQMAWWNEELQKWVIGQNEREATWEEMQAAVAHWSKPSNFIPMDVILDQMSGIGEQQGSMWHGNPGYMFLYNQWMKAKGSPVNFWWEDLELVSQRRNKEVGFDLEEVYTDLFESLAGNMPAGVWRESIEDALWKPLKSKIWELKLNRAGAIATESDLLQLMPLVQNLFGSELLGSEGKQALSDLMKKWFEGLEESILDETGDPQLAGIANTFAQLIEDGFNVADIVSLRKQFAGEDGITGILLNALAGTMPSAEEIETLLGAGFWEELIDAVLPEKWFDTGPEIEDEAGPDASAAAALHLHLDGPGYIQSVDGLMADMMRAAEQNGLRLVAAPV